MSQLTMGSLFAGIGGFDLGFERAGFKTIWQVEIDEYCRRVLARHFPDAERFGDIRECYGLRGCAGCHKHYLQPVDVVCGGFPCQDVSIVNRDAVGLDGERSGLWFEFERVIGELRPRFVVVENVTALLKRGIGHVLGGLAALGYDSEWHCIPATYFGTRHIRDRVWIVAYSRSLGLEGTLLDRDSAAKGGGIVDWSSSSRALEQIDWNSWLPQPAFVGISDAVPEWVDSINALGNSVVPQIAQWIAERILEAETDTRGHGEISR